MTDFQFLVLTRFPAIQFGKIDFQLFKRHISLGEMDCSTTKRRHIIKRLQPAQLT